MNLIVPFITSLTTGGLSCLAVQGGWLASSLASQLELDLQTQGGNQQFRPGLAQPIILFLIAKLIAYTLLGFLLGAVGAVLQLTPMMNVILMVAIGIFMVGNGLRMLKIHPIFRYFIIEPPSSLTRYIRRTSKNNTSLFTPVFLGAMTILIPCGVAQAMMAVALGTGNPLEGAAIQFAFTLGSTPVFFTIAYTASRLGATTEKYFTRIVAITVIVLGLVAIDSGLNLGGSPVSISKTIDRMTAAISAETASSPVVAADSLQNGNFIQVGDNGYSPKVLHLAANRPVTLTWVTSSTHSCALSVVIPRLNYQKILPSIGQVPLEIPTPKKALSSNTPAQWACIPANWFLTRINFLSNINQHEHRYI